MSNPAYPAYAQTYAAREPYITPAEYKASPTGVNTDTLVVGGDAKANADALLQTIARASSWADTKCEQVLAATQETTVGSYLIVNGCIRVPVDFSPIAEVTAITFGTGSEITTVTDLTTLDIDRRVISIPACGAKPNWRTKRVRTTVSYVSGFANATITVAAAAGTSTLVLDNTLGIVAGSRLTVADPGATELVTVATVAGSTITLTSPLVSAHAVGVNVSALPAAIKQAVVLYTTALIKTKTSQSIVLQSLRQEPQQVAMKDGGDEEESRADMLLAPFRRVS